MPALPKLSPTSYAILGLLAREPRSAYELNGFMQRSVMRVFWPRAESHVYSEPKKLLAHKMVSERRELEIGRNRTVYTITPKGRTALKHWLREESGTELRTPSELMLKLILASEGLPGDGQRVLELSRNVSHADIEQAIAGIDAVLRDPHYGVEGMPWNGIAIKLMADLLIARYNWSKYALEATTEVGGDSNSQQKVEAGIKAYALASRKLHQAIKD